MACLALLKKLESRIEKLEKENEKLKKYCFSSSDIFFLFLCVI